MSIEDVNYLKTNSMQDSSLLFIDSRNRDHEMYPTPSEYVVNFEKPFRLVYGFEILDAAIPAATYNIDSYNNTFAITRIVQADPDVTLDELFEDLRWVTDFVSIVDYKENSADTLIITPAHWDELPVELTDFTLAPPGLANDKLPWYTVVIRNEVTLPAIYDNRRGVFTDNDEYLVLAQEPPFAIDANAYPDVLADVQDQRLVVHVDPDTRELTVFRYEVRWVSQDCVQFLRDINAFTIDLRATVTHIERQNYDINTLMANMQGALTTLQITIGSSTTGIVEMASKYAFTCPNDFYFDMNKSSIQTVIGCDTFTRAKDAGSYQPIPWLPSRNRLFRAKYNDADRNYRMIPPGIINLAGIRYMILRCPEIEQHSNSHSFMQTSPGIAVLKLATTNDVTHLRFDFVNLVRKPFHPIGKLTRLTLKFQLPSGELYDFKYVNHQMLLAVKYYVPERDISSQLANTSSVLNPAYNPDFMKYYIKHMPSRTLPRENTLMRVVAGADEEEEDDDGSEYTTSSDDD